MALLTQRESVFLAASVCTVVSEAALVLYNTRRIMPQSLRLAPNDMTAFIAPVIKLDPATAQQVFVRAIEVEKNAAVRAEIEQTCAEGTLAEMDRACARLRAQNMDAARGDNHLLSGLTRDGVVKLAAFTGFISPVCVGADATARGDPMVIISVPTVSESGTHSLLAMFVPILNQAMKMLGIVAEMEARDIGAPCPSNGAEVEAAVYALSLVAEYHHTLVRWGDPFVFAMRVRRSVDLPERTPGLYVYAELEKTRHKKMEKFMKRAESQDSRALCLALTARARAAPSYAREAVEAEFEKYAREHPAIPLDLEQQQAPDQGATAVAEVVAGTATATATLPEEKQAEETCTLPLQQ